jgi:F-type H+-transporting ATPase subunit delta
MLLLWAIVATKNIKNQVTLMKISKTAIAKRYASALFESAIAVSALDKVAEDLARLSEILKSDKVALRFIIPQVVPSSIKSMFLNTVLEQLKPHEIVSNLLRVLVKKNRMFAISSIAGEFTERLRDHKGEVLVEVGSADELSEATLNEIKAAIERSFSKKPIIKHKIDKKLLGGVSVKVGVHMMDNTVRRKLRELKRVSLG